MKRLLVFFVLAVLAVPAWSGDLNVRHYYITNDVSGIRPAVQSIKWFQGERVFLDLYVRRGTTVVDLSAVGLYATWEIIGKTNPASLYICATGTIANATNGYITFNLSPSNANLATNTYDGYVKCYQGSTNLGVVFRSDVETWYSLSGTNYAYVGPITNGYVLNWGVLTLVGTAPYGLLSDGLMQFTNSALAITGYVFTAAGAAAGGTGYWSSAGAGDITEIVPGWGLAGFGDSGILTGRVSDTLSNEFVRLSNYDGTLASWVANNSNGVAGASNNAISARTVANAASSSVYFVSASGVGLSIVTNGTPGTAPSTQTVTIAGDGGVASSNVAAFASNGVVGLQSTQGVHALWIAAVSGQVDVATNTATNYLTLDGLRPMGAALNMGRQDVTNARSIQVGGLILTNPVAGIRSTNNTSYFDFTPGTESIESDNRTNTVHWLLYGKGAGDPSNSAQVLLPLDGTFYVRDLDYNPLIQAQKGLVQLYNLTINGVCTGENGGRLTNFVHISAGNLAATNAVYGRDGIFTNSLVVRGTNFNTILDALQTSNGLFNTATGAMSPAIVSLQSSNSLFVTATNNMDTILDSLQSSNSLFVTATNNMDTILDSLQTSNGLLSTATNNIDTILDSLQTSNGLHQGGIAAVSNKVWGQWTPVTLGSFKLSTATYVNSLFNNMQYDAILIPSNVNANAAFQAARVFTQLYVRAYVVAGTVNAGETNAIALQLLGHNVNVGQTVSNAIVSGTTYIITNAFTNTTVGTNWFYPTWSVTNAGINPVIWRFIRNGDGQTGTGHTWIVGAEYKYLP